MYRRATLHNNTIHLAFSADHNDFYHIIDEIKKLQSPKFNPEIKEWTVALTMQNISRLTLLGFEFDEDLFKQIYEAYKNIREIKEDLKLNKQADTEKQNTIMNIILEYVEGLSDNNRKLECSQNLIKFIRHVCVILQQKSI